MELDRLNPVALITGAASGMGAACAGAIARRAEGGLILIDANEAGLEATADALDRPPERVSTLAFDTADQTRWAQAAEFIRSQYGRLDWAIVGGGAAGESELVQWSGPPADLEGVFLSLRATMELMRRNTTGGAIVVTAPADTMKAELAHGYGALKAGLLQLVRAAAREGAADDIRVNAVGAGAGDTPAWASAPWFHELAQQNGGDYAALEALAAMEAPLVRFAAGPEPARAMLMLLSEHCPLTGATLMVDAGYTI